jgi:hypothetical protein
MTIVWGGLLGLVGFGFSDLAALELWVGGLAESFALFSKALHTARAIHPGEGII